jgi:HAD superfamily hydrolase (TIGR01450 family)
MEKKLFIFDIDGTIVVGRAVIQHILPFLNLLKEQGKAICFLTNNTSLSKDDHMKHLSEILPIDLTNRVYTPLDQVVRYLKSENIEKIFLLGTGSVKNFFTSNGFFLTEEDPEAVIVTFDTSLTYPKLISASKILMTHNTKFVLSNKDLRCPTEFGYIPDAGSIAQMIKTTTDHEIEYTCGKPSTDMLQTILQDYGVSVNDCVFFGDRLYTDIPMGLNAGILTVLVLTGETKISDINIDDERRGYIILESYKALLD